MSSFLNFIENIFSKNKKDHDLLPPPHYLLQINDYQGLYNYFLDNVKYYLSIQHSIDGYNKELNRPNWVKVMCEELYQKINYYRTHHSKSQISMSELLAKEELATFQTDYPFKLSLYCTDLCLDRENNPEDLLFTSKD